MSLWYEAKKEETEIDSELKTVDFLVKSTNQGNEYLSVPFELFLELAREVENYYD